jgi:hypothetical protein
MKKREWRREREEAVLKMVLKTNGQTYLCIKSDSLVQYTTFKQARREFLMSFLKNRSEAAKER